MATLALRRMATSGSPDGPAHGSSSMLAACYHRHGPPSEVVRVEEVPRPPAPGPGQLLLRVRAAALNPADWKSGAGGQATLLRFEWPRVYGFDFSGEVVAVGPTPEGGLRGDAFSVGDEVFGMIRGLPEAGRGSLAEYMLVDSHICARKPANVSHSGCAAVPLVAITAVKMFRACGLKELEGGAAEAARHGPRVFITGGTGGVGSIAIQLAKRLYGAVYVVTTASEGPKADLCRRLGADLVLNYREKDFLKAIQREQDIVKVLGFDACLDCIGEAWKLVPLLKKGGSLVSIANGPTQLAISTWLEEAEIDPSRITFGVRRFLLSGAGGTAFELASGACSLKRACRRKEANFAHVIGTGDGEIMARIAKLLELGKVEPIIDRSFPLAEALQAIEYQAAGHAAGKVVVMVPQ